VTSGGASTDDELPPGIGAPARRALTAAGYLSLADLAGVSEQELLRLHGVGPKAVRILRAILAERGTPLTPPSQSRR
jgi:hypothetical protein